MPLKQIIFTMGTGIFCLLLGSLLLAANQANAGLLVTGIIILAVSSVSLQKTNRSQLKLVGPKNQVKTTQLEGN